MQETLSTVDYLYIVVSPLSEKMENREGEYLKVQTKTSILHRKIWLGLIISTDLMIMF